MLKILVLGLFMLAPTDDKTFPAMTIALLSRDWTWHVQIPVVLDGSRSFGHHCIMGTGRASDARPAPRGAGPWPTAVKSLRVRGEGDGGLLLVTRDTVTKCHESVYFSNLICTIFHVFKGLVPLAWARRTPRPAFHCSCGRMSNPMSP
jgi:hypothetical protein